MGGCFYIKSRNGQLSETDNSTTWGRGEVAEDGQCGGGTSTSLSHICRSGRSSVLGKLLCSGQTRVTALLLPGSLFLHHASPQEKEPPHGHTTDLPGPLLPVRHSLHNNEVSWGYIKSTLNIVQ